jgi:hypothetical protein
MFAWLLAAQVSDELNQVFLIFITNTQLVQATPALAVNPAERGLGGWIGVA